MTLSDDALRGLVAELWVLGHVVIPQASDPLAAVAAWEGPSGRPKDFASGAGWAHEVKAIGLQGNSIEIHGAEQLDDDGFEDFKLEVITTEMAATDGHNLEEIVDALCQKLGEVPSYDLSLKMNQIAPGYSTSLYENRRVAVHRHRSYRIDGDMPRITQGDLPSGITHVTYAIDLAELEPIDDLPISKDSQWTL